MFICFGARRDKDELSPVEKVIIVFIIGLALYPTYLEIKTYLYQLKINLTNFFTLQNTIIFSIASIICFCLVCLTIRKIMAVRNIKEQRRASISYKRDSINRLLKSFHSILLDRDQRISLEEFISSLKKIIKEITDFEELKKEKALLKIELNNAEEELIKREKQEELDYLKAVERHRLEEIEREKREIAQRIEYKKAIILDKLDLSNNRVFKKDKLSKRQYKFLIEEGYRQVNEYCVLEKKRIVVLVKPFGNHSISHQFLIWSAKKLIQKTKGVENIQEHLTRDADLTFRFRGKYFALEIEKGDLLRKKNQLIEKLDYLNTKYPKRWMFVVSNRNFLSKYKKFGFTTTRNRMCENLQKLLKNTHTNCHPK